MTPFHRVRRFIAEWNSAWLDAKDMTGPERAQEWFEEALRDVTRTHFAAGVTSSVPVLGDVPEHEPGREFVVDTFQEGDDARIHTRHRGRYFAYALTRDGETWKITRVRGSRTELPPAKGSPPLVAEAEHGVRLARTSLDGLLDPVPPRVEPRCEALFEAGRAVVHRFRARRGTDRKDREQHGEIVIQSGLELHTRSGILCVADPALLAHAYPLRRSITPGSYAVQIARFRSEETRKNDELPIAARVLFGSPRATVTWQWGGNVGVDAGQIAVVDYVAALELTQHEAHVLALGGAEADVRALALRSPGDGVCFEGIGDGMYPVYMGFDTEGAPTMLVVDFMLLAEVTGAGKYRNG